MAGVLANKDWRGNKKENMNNDACGILGFMAFFLNGAYYTRTLFFAAIYPSGLTESPASNMFVRLEDSRGAQIAKQVMAILRPRRLFFLASLCIFALLCLAQAPRQVKVIIDNASIRSKPELDAEILDVAAKGTLFQVIEKAGAWYAIKMGEDQAAKAVYGYIHESMVEPIGRVEPQPQAVREPEPSLLPPPPPQEPPSPRRQLRETPTEVRSHDKLVSGAFIKYGFGDHWLASSGFDLGIGRHFGIGLEIQPYYTQSSDIDRSVLQLDVFVNAKLGFKLWFFTVYGGGGLGPALSFANTEIEGQSFSKFKTMLAYHGILGLALNIGRVAVVFEFQPIVISDPELGPDTWGRFFFIGLRF